MPGARLRQRLFGQGGYRRDREIVTDRLKL